MTLLPFKLTPWRILAGTIAVIVLLLLLVWFKDAIGGGVERINRWRHEKAVATERAEIEKLKAQNKQLTDEMKKAYALGEAKELERDAAYAELEKYGAAARAAVAAQKEASKEYEAEKASIAIDVPLYQRCKDLCAERAAVGYACKPNGDAYCQRYSGR